MMSNMNLLQCITPHSKHPYIQYRHGIQQLFLPFPPIFESQELSHVAPRQHHEPWLNQNHLTVQLLSAYVIQITHNLVKSCKGCPTPTRNQPISRSLHLQQRYGRIIRPQNPCHFHLTFSRIEQMLPSNSDPTFHPPLWTSPSKNFAMSSLVSLRPTRESSPKAPSAALLFPSDMTTPCWQIQSTCGSKATSHLINKRWLFNTKILWLYCYSTMGARF